MARPRKKKKGKAWIHWTPTERIRFDGEPMWVNNQPVSNEERDRRLLERAIKNAKDEEERARLLHIEIRAVGDRALDTQHYRHATCLALETGETLEQLLESFGATRTQRPVFHLFDNNEADFEDPQDAEDFLTFIQTLVRIIFD